MDAVVRMLGLGTFPQHLAGDMLYQPADLPRPVRIQGVFVSDAEVKAVADFWREQEPEPPYDPDVLSGSGDGDDGRRRHHVSRPEQRVAYGQVGLESD